jgi:hypothetical protein
MNKPANAEPLPKAAKVIYELEGAECKKCGHKWIPKVFPPRRCANCNDPRWWLPYIYNIKRGGKDGRPPRRGRKDWLPSEVQQRKAHRRKLLLQKMRRQARAKNITKATLAAAKRED